MHKTVNFAKELENRFTSDTPIFWKRMKPILGSLFGGLSALQASISDTSPEWTKWVLVFFIGALGYMVGNFGTNDKQLLDK